MSTVVMTYRRARRCPLSTSLIFTGTQLGYPDFILHSAPTRRTVGHSIGITFLAFAGLTTIVFVTAKDFSFLRGILCWGGIVALRRGHRRGQTVEKSSAGFHSSDVEFRLWSGRLGVVQEFRRLILAPLGFPRLRHPAISLTESVVSWRKRTASASFQGYANNRSSGAKSTSSKKMSSRWSPRLRRDKWPRILKSKLARQGQALDRSGWASSLKRAFSTV